MTDKTKVPEAPDLEGFARALLKVMHGYNGGSDLDGADFQKIATKHGVLVEVEVVTPCGDLCVCSEVGSFDYDRVTICYRPWFARLEGEVSP